MKKLLCVLAVIAVVSVIASPATAQCQPKAFKWDFNPPLAIPDFGAAGPGLLEVPLIVPSEPGCNVIADLDVDMIIDHTWQGDIKIELIKGSNSTVLIDRPGTEPGLSEFGYSSDNFGNPLTRAKFIFDDAAMSTYDVPHVLRPGIANVTGRWKPEGGLGMFNGKPKDGDWVFRITDNAAGDIGFLHNLSLEFVNVPEPATIALLGLGGLAMLRRRR